MFPGKKISYFRAHCRPGLKPGPQISRSMSPVLPTCFWEVLWELIGRPFTLLEECQCERYVLTLPDWTTNKLELNGII